MIFVLANENENINDKKGNAGLFIFSYPNITSKNIDFVEEAFNNNGKFLILNVTENCIINNNIFGYKISSIKIKSFQDNDFLEVDTSLMEEQ